MAEDTGPTTPALGEPFCGECGHQLTGLIDSSKCPECGRPLVEVLTRQSGRWGRRYTSETTLFGMPILAIALGSTPTERIGHARGIIAIGDKATGWIAMGGLCRGIVAMGGTCFGVVTLGGMSFGLLSAWGGIAVGLMAQGGLALGMFALGGMAVGYVASGGMAIGVYATGGSPIAPHALGPGRNDAAALSTFGKYAWFFGPVGFGLMNFVQPMLVHFGLAAVIAAAIGIMVWVAHARHNRAETPQP